MSAIVRPAMIIALSALLSVAPACTATAGHKWGKSAPAAGANGAQRRISLRPLYDPARTKKFYLGGYAGANYTPSGPGTLMYPSTYKQATNLGPHSTFNFPWHGN